ncbi:hypothetical protein [Paraburkholderia sp. HD33-4]|uniref:hypothetical protein n=1 Tax=Paraburkholderia sp. HD33-4 TaxID=2883242 RepID=UPI001F2834B4|nr:hypothetical protein [Paraburkholderia sp. HD33-4]
MMTTETKSRGRPTGTFHAGSLASRLFELEVGQSVLEEDRDGTLVLDNCKRSMRAVTKHDPAREYDMKLHLGVAVKGDEMPVRFYRIRRTK